MHFHRVHGSAIALSDDKLVATRKEDFCNGLAFSSQPLKIGQKICIELTQVSEWSSAIRIGVTSEDPGKLCSEDLPRYACPDLTKKSGHWARALSEKYADTGNRITFYVNSSGQMHYFVNNEHKGALLSHLPTAVPLWTLFDIYGNTNSAKFVPADEVPVEILARGPDALSAYHQACESGTQPVFRTRLMLVGQDRVGKTSLKKSLMGQRHDTAEASTGGIDLSASCSFNVTDRKAWKVALKGDASEAISETQSPGLKGLGSREDLEEEYHQAIASNIVQELLYRKKQREKDEREQDGRDSERRNSKTSSATIRGVPRETDRKKKERVSASGRRDTMKDDLKFHELVQEVPQRVVELVEGMIHEKENSETHGKPELDRSTSGKNITLNIWDFAGQAIYHTTHQVFLSSRAVYIIVFNLCHDLDEPAKTLVRRDTLSQVEWEQSEFSNLDFMDFWMSCIHGHTAQNTRNSVDNTTLSPPVFIVGTHRNSLSDQKQTQSSLVEDKFRRIREMMQQKPYWHHIIPHFYAVENNVDSGEDQQVVVLRRHIEEVASKEPYMGERMPIKWLKIEQAVQQLVEGATHFVSLDQIREVAQGEGVTADDEFKTLLEFYHDLGVIIYYGGPSTLDNVLRNTVILQPQWLIDMFKRVIASNMSDQQWGNFRDSWLRLDKSGILEERLIDHLWKDALSQKPALLGLMEKFDLVCHRLPSEETREAEIVGRTYYVPLRLRPHAETFKLYSPSKEDVVFYYDFNGFLPDGLFHRIVTRAVRWSQEHSKPLPHMPQLSHRKARLYLDEEHDFVLEMAPAKQARIKVVALREVDLEESDDASTDSEEKPLPPPKPSACAKARNFLESVLSDLREMWMKRISYQACVQCPCDKVCKLHDKPKCPEPSCVHFLNLDECLSNKIVCCDYRRVKTSVFRKWFPAPVPIVKQGPILPDTVMQETYGNIEATKGSELPSWVKSAAKLLNGGSEGQDWTALAKKLGYKKTKMEKFNDDLNPALALITDWIISSGNTALSVDMMVSCLEQMQRDDIVDIIQKGQESEIEPPQVFISYQWDSQDDVRALRDKLEKSGLSCWMDIGQMGGGDQLYARIDKGIRNSKVVIACVTPKYVVSHHCNRELSLADLLRKPIIPVMYESVAWPPPGGMSLMLTQLVYINMKGVGGHGGSGIHADLEDKYQEVIQRVCCYAVPDPNLCSTQQSPRTEPTKTSDQFISEPSMHSESLGSPLSVADPAVIPGYVQQDFVHHHPPTGRGHVNEPAATGNQGPGPPIPVPRPQGVEQVHVTKCAVCTIL